MAQLASSEYYKLYEYIIRNGDDQIQALVATVVDSQYGND